MTGQGGETLTEAPVMPGTMTRDQVVIDKIDQRKYRIELPNMVDDADLDPYEFRLLAHYKRVGTCTEGTATTAEKCHMSTGKVSEVRQSLADKGWIAMERLGMGEGRYRYRITVIDHWLENFSKYSKTKSPSLHEASPSPHEANPSPHEARPSLHETSPSPHEGKNKHIKNQPIKNQPIKNERDITQTGFQQVLSALEGLCGSVTMDTVRLIDTWLEKHAPERSLQAVGVAMEKRARSPKYVDQVLIGWEVNGYPPTREQQVLARAFKPAKGQNGTDKPHYKIPEYSEADLAIVAEINRMSALRRAGLFRARPAAGTP